MQRMCNMFFKLMYKLKQMNWDYMNVRLPIPDQVIVFEIHNLDLCDSNNIYSASGFSLENCCRANYPQLSGS